MKKTTLTILILLQYLISVSSVCRQLDDASFLGIYGRISLRDQYCVDSDFSEVRNYIATRISSDGMLTIENSNIGNIKNELVANNKASQIITFSCINCKINTIEKEGLKKLAKLYNFTLYGNDIEDFDGTFIKNDNLRFQYLNLTNNNIKKVENLCLGTPTTKTIILKDNPIKNIDDKLFKDCKLLQYLDISNTSIKITKNMFTENTNLTELYLQNLSINNIYDITVYIPNLISLDLSFNNIQELDTNLFHSYAHLKILNLNNNKLSGITYSTDKNFPLRQLYLRNNNINNVSIVNLQYFKDLQTLDLSYNKIKDIPVHFLEHCVDLRHILLRNNQLKKLPIGIFSPTPNIVQLDLSYNNFSSFDEHLLYSLQYLEEFYVSGNNITAFEPYMLGSMVSTLKRLGISDLHWQCDNLAYFVRFCKSHNINCLPNDEANFKTSNLQGIVCTEKKKEESTFRYDPGSREKYYNITSESLLQQNEFYKLQLNVISHMNVILLFLTLFAMVFVIYKVATPIFLTFFNRYRNRRDLLNSAHLNVSHMELMHNHV